MIWVRRDSQRVVLPPVEALADRWVEVERHRAACCGEPKDLHQDRPNHQLLVEDWLIPPAPDVVKFKAGCERCCDDQAKQRIEENFPYVKHCRLFWRAEACFHPVQLEEFHAWQKWDLREFVEIDWR